jgi:hypothetical protein
MINIIYDILLTRLTKLVDFVKLMHIASFRPRVVPSVNFVPIGKAKPGLCPARPRVVPSVKRSFAKLRWVPQSEASLREGEAWVPHIVGFALAKLPIRSEASLRDSVWLRLPEGSEASDKEYAYCKH